MLYGMFMVALHPLSFSSKNYTHTCKVNKIFSCCSYWW